MTPAQDAVTGDPENTPARAETGLTGSEQNRFFWQRSMLLTGGARGFGCAAVIGATVSVLTPGGLSPVALVVELVALALLLTCALCTVIYPNLVWISASFGTAQLAMLALWAGPDEKLSNSTVVAIIFLAGWGAGHVGVLLTDTWGHVALLLVFGLMNLVHLSAIIISFGIRALVPISLVLGSWGIAAAFGYWLNRAFPRVMRRVDGLGRAHHAEARASEREAQRRRDARLLHDTALATLSLLAHSGVGVASDALRAQAASDRDLLARLASGEGVTAEASGDYSLTTNAPTAPTEGVERLVERFAALGLTVSVYGTADALPGSEAGATLLLAVGECLENTRRHSGEAEATLTLSEDDTAFRALVTDTGVGFDRDAVPAERLGFAESVVGRIEAIGGKVRVFSAPGAGTTIMMEVPR